MHLLGIKYTIAIIFSTTITQIIKRTVNRCRPFLTIKNLNIRKIGIDKYSFPSGHTVSAFTLGAMISLFYPAVTCICILIACLVGISRIYLGVHYPSDVLIGAILGSISSFFIFYLI
jgi:undecaprenyl-diphosphatase